MDDLKNIVIQNLEQEGTLGSLRAQLRARVFKAIENYADNTAKQAAGFQWQNPAAAKVHEDPDTKLVALLVKDFLEHYKMDYTLSVYLPEIALSGTQDQVSKEELAQKAGLAKDGEGPLLLQLLKQSKNPVAPAPAQTKKAEESKTAAPAQNTPSPAPPTSQQQPAPSTGKSPFTSKTDNSRPQQFSNAGAIGVDDLIEEDIVQDHEDIQLQPNSARDDLVGASGNSASKSAMGIDQSIDTLNLDAYDYVEDVKITPRQ